MSTVVKKRLKKADLLSKTTSKDRQEIDKKIEQETGKYCDIGVHDLSDEQFRLLVESVLEQKKEESSSGVQKISS